jgi:hypothetical protein
MSITYGYLLGLISACSYFHCFCITQKWRLAGSTPRYFSFLYSLSNAGPEGHLYCLLVGFS